MSAKGARVFSVRGKHNRPPSCRRRFESGKTLAALSTGQ